MAEFPTLKESSIFTPIPIASGAEGHEAFAKTLGAIAESSEKKAEEIATDQSQAMFMTSVANAKQVETQAKIRMLENPGAAPKIASQTSEAIDAIQQGAYVNNKDRSRLKYFLQGSKDDVLLKATETEVKQRQNEAAFTHYANWGDQLKAYQQALVSDPAKAETLHNAMISTLHGLVNIRAITPEQAGSGFKDMGAMANMAQDVHTAMQIMQQGGQVDARTYQTMASNPVSNAPPDPNSPVNGSTGWMVNYYNTDKSFQGVLAGIPNKQFNPVAFSTLTPPQRAEALEQMQGVRIADGMVNSGESFPAIEKTYASLNESHKVLSYKEQGMRNYLANYINDLKSGNYLQVMGKTPMGAGILQDFTSTDAAIQNSALDNDVKARFMLNNKNNMVNAAVSYGEGHHIPSQYIQPIPIADVAQVENSFKIGQKPEVALAIMKSYSPQNQLYLADAMKDPAQKVVLKTIALGTGSVTDQESIDFIAANQKGFPGMPGRNYREIDLTTQDSLSDNKLKNSINSQISDATQIIMSQYDASDATILNGELIKAGVNYAKYLSEKKGQFSMKEDGTIWGSTDNVGQVAKFINSSYEKMSGANYIVNKKQVNLSQPEMDTVAEYAVNEGYKYLKSHVSETDYLAIRDRTDLTVSITPKNVLKVKDSSGNVYFSSPFSNNLVAHAGEENKRTREERQKESEQLFRPRTAAELLATP